MNEQLFSVGTNGNYSIIKTEKIWISDNDFGAFKNNSDPIQKYIIDLFCDASIQHNLTFRVYRTLNGIRAFITNTLKPINYIEIMRQVNCDHSYITACHRDNFFACRISPKSKNVPFKFAVTKFLTTIGNQPVLKNIQELIDFHDLKTKAFSDYPLF